ncbi:hypothetical protein ACLUXJ_05765 [Lactobacillus porci]|uniref:hypothetical protein n=1 Tax=Lactobacillus porci TaxID=2012477 RepID=UPI003993C407
MRKCANCGRKLKTNATRVVFKDGLLCPNCYQKITGEKVLLWGWKESFKFMKTKISDLPDYHGVLCPNCGSTHVELLGENRKDFSFGKAAGGALLAGGVGLLAGFAGKKDGTKFFCDACHKTFKVK